jgi:hypothetical protein
MPLADRLVHSLAIIRMIDGAVDPDTGHPARTPTVLATPKGFVYPKSAREVAELSQAGAEVGEYSIILPHPTDVTGADYVRFEPDDGRRFEIKGRRPYEFGRDPLIALDAKLVTAST